MSLFTVNKNKVVQASTNALKAVDQYREDHIKNFVDAKMNRKWFKPKTREEAWKMVREDWSRIPCPPPWLWGNETKVNAENLLKACKISKNEYVYLDTKESKFVEEWLNS